MSYWENLLLILVGADTVALALIVALAAIALAGAALWAAVKLSKGRNEQ